MILQSTLKLMWEKKKKWINIWLFKAYTLHVYYFIKGSKYISHIL